MEILRNHLGLVRSQDRIQSSIVFFPPQFPAFQLVEIWYPGLHDCSRGLVIQLLSEKMVEDSGFPCYKKWRFNADAEPSRSTLWRRRKRKRTLESQSSEKSLPDNVKRQIQSDSIPQEDGVACSAGVAADFSIDDLDSCTTRLFSDL